MADHVPVDRITLSLDFPCGNWSKPYCILGEINPENLILAHKPAIYRPPRVHDEIIHIQQLGMTMPSSSSSPSVVYFLGAPIHPGSKMINEHKFILLFVKVFISVGCYEREDKTTEWRREKGLQNTWRVIMSWQTTDRENEADWGAWQRWRTSQPDSIFMHSTPEQHAAMIKNGRH